MRFKLSTWWLVVPCLILIGLLCSRPLDAGPEIRSGSLLLMDDFSNPQSGWDTWWNEESQSSYQDGGLRLAVMRPQLDIWSRPDASYGDVRMEVDAVKLNGPAQNDFGLICRYQDGDNFYALLAGSDGSAGIMKVKDGEAYFINTADEQTREVIYAGERLNHLRGDCIGSRLILSVNGHKLVEARDRDFKQGGVGLMAGSFENGGVELLFDNFLVYNP
jgi:hypothetical protein